MGGCKPALGAKGPKGAKGAKGENKWHPSEKIWR